MTKKTIRAWAVVKKNGDWCGQVTDTMSENLVNFYNQSKDFAAVPCTITYNLTP